MLTACRNLFPSHSGVYQRSRRNSLRQSMYRPPVGSHGRLLMWAAQSSLSRQLCQRKLACRRPSRKETRNLVGASGKWTPSSPRPVTFAVELACPGCSAFEAFDPFAAVPAARPLVLPGHSGRRSKPRARRWVGDHRERIFRLLGRVVAARLPPALGLRKPHARSLQTPF